MSARDDDSGAVNGAAHESAPAHEGAPPAVGPVPDASADPVAATAAAQTDGSAADAARSTGGMSGPDGPLLRLVRDRRIAFLVVGSLNTAIGFGWFTLFDFLITPHLGYMVTLVCAHIAAVLCAFVLYRKLVFRVRGHVIRDLLRFETVYLVALGVNAVCLPLLVELAHLPVLLSQALIVFVTTIVSYVGHRYFSFARKKEAA